MRILLADANVEVLAALRLVMEQPRLEQPRLQIVGEVRDTISLFAQVTRCCPDVILLDIDLPGLRLPRRRPGKSTDHGSSNQAASSLAELVGTLRFLCPTIRVIVLSSQPNTEKVCLQAQVDAFVCKSDPPDALLTLLNDV